MKFIILIAICCALGCCCKKRQCICTDGVMNPDCPVCFPVEDERKYNFWEEKTFL